MVDLVEAEEIKKRWKEYIEELYKKIQMNLISTMVWSAIQTQTFWSVKSSVTAGSTAVSRASGCDGIPVELFKTPKDMLSKCCTQHVHKSGRPSSDYRTGKGQSSSQSQEGQY